jgi:hypothetical protein
MRRRVEEIPEPGAGADGGGDTERTVLGELEDLEVVEDDRFGDRRGKSVEGASLEKQSMAAESSAEAGDGGGSAAHGTGNLAMGGAGLEKGRDGTEQLRALEVIEQREAVLGEGAAAAETEKARDAPAAKGEVGAVETDRETAASAAMFGAGGPGAEAGPEIVQSLDGGSWPAHGG